jgi:hypothetical protein
MKLLETASVVSNVMYQLISDIKNSSDTGGKKGV